MESGLDAAYVFESYGEADGAVSAHIEIADVIEEDDAGGTVGFEGFAEKCADDGVITAGFVDDGGAEMVEVAAEALEAFVEGAVAEVGEAFDDETGGFAAGVGINNSDAVHGIRHCIQ